MRRVLPTWLAVLGFVAASIVTSMPAGAATPAAPDQARPRAQSGQRSAEPQRGGNPPATRRAQPRPPDQPPQRRSEPRPTPPPPRVVPPRYVSQPRVYYFPPISLQRGFYYHPYFGFYYGPYYGPYYPYPGPFAGPVRYSSSALRTRVKPVETEVYVNGYYAGQVDDFDGIFQRLYLPAGEHEISFHLDGYEGYAVKLYLGPGDTRDIVHDMRPLAAGEANPVPAPAGPLPEDWTAGPGPTAGDQPASPFGILAIRVVPAGAQVFVDGEAWVGPAGQTELVLHMEPGWHALEVRKDGYQPFRTDIELSEGATTRLNVKLTE